ncbi:MAG: hypothetical protein FJX65_19030, partial [Alphaproteobacteria bacterium]|nr:hypothetical protein [Alphaproteobacteria bacterium]
MKQYWPELALAVLAACSAPERLAAPTDPVGRAADGSRQQTPVNQTLTPHGVFVDLPGMRPLALASSRDGARVFT